MIVEAAPRGDAVKIADVFTLWQRHELLPIECLGILGQPSDLQPPLFERDRRRIAEAQHRPVADDVLIDGDLRQAMTIRRPRALRLQPFEADIHAVAEPALALDVAHAALDERVFFLHGSKICTFTHNENLLAALSLMLIVSTTVYAQNNRSFVSTTGSDANNCTAGNDCR